MVVLLRMLSSVFCRLRWRATLLSVVWSWCLVWLSLGSHAVAAPTNAPAPVRQSQRYLFLIETSRTMKPRAQGVFDTLKGLLDSGLKGQLRRGDTLAIWTFNESLYTGWLPAQEWSSEAQLTLAVREGGLLQSGTYEKSANLDVALAEMRKALHESGLVTVILLTAGEGEMLGTPFDSEINAAWKRWHDEQQKTLMPLVTVLRARNSVISQWSVTPAPWPVEMPPAPVELQVAKAKPIQSAGAGEKLQFSTAPLVVFAKEAGTNVTSKPSATAAESRPKTADAPAPTAKADLLPARPPANSESSVSSEAKPPPAAARETSATPAPAASTNETSSRRVAQIEAPKPAPVTNQPDTPPAPATVPTATESPTRTPPLVTAAEEKPPATTTPVPEPAQTPPVTEKTEPKPTAIAPPPSDAQPVPVAAPPTPVVAEPAPRHPAPTASQPSVAKPAERPPSERPTVAVQTAAGAPQEGFVRKNAMWLALLFVAGLASLFCFRMWLRTYSRPRVSLTELIPLPDPKLRPAPSGKETQSSAGDPEAKPAETQGSVEIGTEGGT